MSASIARPRSARLVFSALSRQNLQDFHALVCDEHIRRFMLDGQTMSFEWCEHILTNTTDEKATTGLGLWLMSEVESEPPFGFAGYLRLDGPDAPLQLIYAVRATHTGRGFIREAAVAMIDFAREHCARGDIAAAVDEPNVASSAVLDKLGFVCTGIGSGNFGHLLQYTLRSGCAPRERRTSRLVLRALRASDSESFARLNADPRVMEHFPNTLSRAESDNLLQGLRETFDQRGFGPWALELAHVEGCIGIVGLSVPKFKSHFTPCVEVAWRLAYEHWGHGYAQEAAHAALYTAFVHLELEQVVAFTATNNQRSQRVMQALGMRRNPNEDFEHPSLPLGHPLRPHVLYRVDRARWRAAVHESTP